MEALVRDKGAEFTPVALRSGSGMLAGGVQCLGRGAFIAGHRCPVSTKAAQLQRPHSPSIQALLHPAEQSPPAPSLPRHDYQQPLHNVPTATEFSTIQHVPFEGNQQDAASNGLQQQDHLEEAQRVQQEEAAQGRDQEHWRQQQELEGAAPGEQEQQPQAAVATRVVIVAVDPDTHGAVTMATWVTNDPLNAAVDLSQLEDVRVFDMPCATVELIGKKKPTGKPSKRRWLDVVSSGVLLNQVLSLCGARTSGYQAPANLAVTGPPPPAPRQPSSSSSSSSSNSSSPSMPTTLAASPSQQPCTTCSTLSSSSSSGISDCHCSLTCSHSGDGSSGGGDSSSGGGGGACQPAHSSQPPLLLELRGYVEATPIMPLTAHLGTLAPQCESV
ncbi:hypothetical protein QJQ45_001261 [Haematococcus lacustris]|nr:hypothetical protein QJQ45_001261 [Haematococcus lacustris]